MKGQKIQTAFRNVAIWGSVGAEMLRQTIMPSNTLMAAQEKLAEARNANSINASRISDLGSRYETFNSNFMDIAPPDRLRVAPPEFTKEEVLGNAAIRKQIFGWADYMAERYFINPNYRKNLENGFLVYIGTAKSCVNNLRAGKRGDDATKGNLESDLVVMLQMGQNAWEMQSLSHSYRAAGVLEKRLNGSQQVTRWEDTRDHTPLFVDVNLFQGICVYVIQKSKVDMHSRDPFAGLRALGAPADAQIFVGDYAVMALANNGGQPSANPTITASTNGSNTTTTNTNGNGNATPPVLRANPTSVPRDTATWEGIPRL